MTISQCLLCAAGRSSGAPFFERLNGSFPASRIIAGRKAASQTVHQSKIALAQFKRGA